MNDSVREAFEALRNLSNAIQGEWADEHFDTIKAALSGAQQGEAVRCIVCNGSGHHPEPIAYHQVCCRQPEPNGECCGCPDAEPEWGACQQCGGTGSVMLTTTAPQPAQVPEGLTFNALRKANAERIGSSKFQECEKHWTPAHWMQATVGELGELANILKKVDRGDFPFSEVKADVGRELADVQTYLDILALKLGIDLGRATIDKFNEVSERIGSHVTLTAAPSGDAADGTVISYGTKSGDAKREAEIKAQIIGDLSEKAANSEIIFEAVYDDHQDIIRHDTDVSEAVANWLNREAARLRQSSDGDDSEGVE